MRKAKRGSITAKEGKEEIARVVYSMYIFLKMLRLQENMTVYIWQIAIIVNMHINMHLKWCTD